MEHKAYSQEYSGSRNSHVAFPLGGIGAGMFCLEGTGAFSHFSLRNTPDVTNEPMVFAAVCVKGKDSNIARVMEGQVPTWKIFGNKAENVSGPGNGLPGKHFGLPRFAKSSFTGKFPFGTVKLKDEQLPIDAEIIGWSPFVPLNADDSSLPVAGLEINFVNKTDQPVELVFSFNCGQIMAAQGAENHTVQRSSTGSGFVLVQPPVEGKPWERGSFCAVTDHPGAKVDCAWFRGGWFDPLTMIWNNIQAGQSEEKPELTEGNPSPGASIFVPLKLPPHGRHEIRLQLSWYVPESNLTVGVPASNGIPPSEASYHKPWYAGKFSDISDVSGYWLANYNSLREKSDRFGRAFFETTLPSEALEAVAANLSILKSPTILRQVDGRLWGWEGVHLKVGCCSGSCTHVWNYAQSIPHLFPDLERGLRETEFIEGQDEHGHQNFRVPLPIQPADHLFHAAADGQLGGIMKAYREWRIGGETKWLRMLWPRIKSSLHYCMEHWDPDEMGVLIEPHHNTYDIEFWGPDGMCSSIYLGALKAAARIAEALGESGEHYESLYRKGREYLETELFNGEYYEQKIIWEGLRAPSPTEATPVWNVNYSTEAMLLLQKEGPKYQYGKGCLSDGVIGAWLAEMCGLEDILNRDQVKSHLLSIHKFNLKRDLSRHANPQRPGYALGDDGGLLLCTWPNGGQLALPFVYSDEVWTGIEYQVASHLLAVGCIEEGLEIVRICRDRYDGRKRNPFDEYECGHWYARAMASYGLIQGWSGIWYDAVNRVLNISPKVTGDYSSFLCTSHGYGMAGIRDGKPFLDVREGSIDVSIMNLVH